MKLIIKSLHIHAGKYIFQAGTILIVFLFVTFFTQRATAQQLVVSPMTEKAVTGWQVGTVIKFQAKSKWALGGFYQTSITGNVEYEKVKDTFYGAVVYAPIVRTDKLVFYINLRGGVVNEKFVAIAPGVETEINLLKNLSFALGTSLRMQYPSATARINIKLF
jgi:hypothetical protein